MRETQIAQVFIGPTGTGKSHRAWEEAGLDAYIKTSSNKWWDGYKGQKNVIIDEFDGMIGITHLLRWLDKYPCYVEIKGGTYPLFATHFWITSNNPVSCWWGDDTKVSVRQRKALLRRIKVEELTEEFIQ